MEKLITVQKREKLNTVSRADEPGPGGAHHIYIIEPVGISEGIATVIDFQKGARKDPDAITGVIDSDLLEIVLDRYKAFQAGPFSSRENAIVITHIEEALMWMNRRVEDRIERNVLGTYEK